MTQRLEVVLSWVVFNEHAEPSRRAAERRYRIVLQCLQQTR